MKHARFGGKSASYPVSFTQLSFFRQIKEIPYNFGTGLGKGVPLSRKIISDVFHLEMACYELECIKCEIVSNYYAALLIWPFWSAHALLFSPTNIAKLFMLQKMKTQRTK